MTIISRSTYSMALTSQTLQDAYTALPVGVDIPILVVHGSNYIAAVALCRSVYGDNFRTLFQISIDTQSGTGPDVWAFRVPL